MKPSMLSFVRELPPPSSLGPRGLLVFDRRLDAAVPGFASWRKGFPAACPVEAGEDLKDVRSFPRRIEDIVSLSRGLGQAGFIAAAGGGSVGDFAGFAASVLRRGVPLVHIPTTWLAALDSSHGGKTALNVGGLKNQLGTFHPATRVVLARRVLLAQPRRAALDARGELAKIALIDGGAWVRRLVGGAGGPVGNALLWKFLRPAVEAKLKVVRRDPREESGLRRVLNLGHTLGHALEPLAGLSHGAAVAQGLAFSLAWSGRRWRVPAAETARWRRLLEERLGILPLPGSDPRWTPVRRARLLGALAGDKKSDAPGTVEFVFLRRLGRPVRETVRLAEVADQAVLQGYAR